jgi:DNA invertase Pin-like site-specific DNA recombinase
VKRALLYARQSDSAGDGDRSLSLGSQLTVLRADAERNGWVVVGEIRDADEKGWNDQRPGLLELYARCREGSVDVVAFWSLSRLARSVRITEQVVHELDRVGVALHSNQESWVAEPMMRQVMASFAEQQTRDIRNHVRRAVRERVRRGIAHGRAPFGYQRGEGGRLVPSPDAETVRRIFRWRLEGCSLVGISALLHEAGIPAPTGGRWSRPTLAELLTNPVYIGTLHLAEIAQPDAHEAIVDRALWERTQQHTFPNRDRFPRTKVHRSWLEGAIVHACGAPMYLVGGSPGRPILSFRCRVGGGWGDFGVACPFSPRMIRMDRAEELTWEAIHEALARLPSPRSVLRQTQRRYRLESPTAEAVTRDMEARSRRVAAERERVIYMFRTGTIPHARFDREMAQIMTEEQEVAARLAALPVTPSLEAIETAWNDLRALRDALPLAADEERGRLLRAIGTAVVSPAGYPVVRSGPGRREDAGRVRLRARPGLAPFFPASDT